MTMLADTERHAAEYLGGWLFITEHETGAEYLTRLENERGQCITRGQFKDACRTHGPDRACDTFKKLAAKEAIR